MSRARISVIVAAIVQMMAASGWIIALVWRHGSGHRAVPVLIVHFLVGALVLVTQASGRFRRTLVVMNWLLVALWTWTLLAAVATSLRGTSKPYLVPLVIVLILLTLVPCAINAVVLGELPKRES